MYMSESRDVALFIEHKSQHASNSKNVRCGNLKKFNLLLIPEEPHLHYN